MKMFRPAVVPPGKKDTAMTVRHATPWCPGNEAISEVEVAVENVANEDEGKQ